MARIMQGTAMYLLLVFSTCLPHLLLPYKCILFFSLILRVSLRFCAKFTPNNCVFPKKKEII